MDMLGFMDKNETMDEMLDRILQDPGKVVLEWMEPWQAADGKGNELNANLTLRATAGDCINMQRWSRMKSGAAVSVLEKADRELLDAFICINYATEI